MPNEYEATIERLFTEIEALPEKYYRAFLFVMRHYKVLMQVCRKEKLTKKTRQKLIDNAIHAEDAQRLTLVIFERVVNGN